MPSLPQAAALSRRAFALPWRAGVPLAIAIAVAAWIAWAPVLRVIFAVPADPVVHVTEALDGGRFLPSARGSFTGFEPCETGLCLPPGASGAIDYKLETSSYPTALMVWHACPPGGSLRLFLSTDGGTRYQLLSENSTYTGQKFLLPPGEPGKVQLRYEATNPSPKRVLVADMLIFDYYTVDPPRFPKRWAMFLLVLSFGLALVVLSPNVPLALSTVLILALAASLRYEAAINLFYTALDPDTGGYRHYAAVMKLFTDTGFFSARFSEREPGFIFLVHVYHALVGDSAFTLRLLTVGLSTLSVWAVMRVARGAIGLAAGQFAGLLMALNVPLILEAPRGLRLELEIVLCMAFFGIAFVRTWRAPWPLEILAAASCGGALVATRSTYVPIVLALGTYAVYRRVGFKAAIGGALITAAIVAAFVVPHRYSMYKLRGDAYWDTTMYARWNANQEFVGRPGFPSLGELQSDGYIGPRITYNEYMLKLHTPGELFAGTMRGYWKLYRAMEAAPFGVVDFTVRRWIDSLFRALGIAGFLIALWKREYLWIPLAFVLFEFPVSFLYDRGLVEPFRHSYSAFPLVLFAALIACQQLCTKLMPVRTVTPS